MFTIFLCLHILVLSAGLRRGEEADDVEGFGAADDDMVSLGVDAVNYKVAESDDIMKVAQPQNHTDGCRARALHVGFKYGPPFSSRIPPLNPFDEMTQMFETLEANGFSEEGCRRIITDAPGKLPGRMKDIARIWDLDEYERYDTDNSGKDRFDTLLLYGLDWLLQPGGSEQRLFLQIAAHGEPLDKDFTQVGILIPAKAGNTPGRWMASDVFWQGIVSRLGERSLTVLMDTCYSCQFFSDTYFPNQLLQHGDLGDREKYVPPILNPKPPDEVLKQQFKLEASQPLVAWARSSDGAPTESKILGICGADDINPEFKAQLDGQAYRGGTVTYYVVEAIKTPNLTPRELMARMIDKVRAENQLVALKHAEQLQNAVEDRLAQEHLLQTLPAATPTESQAAAQDSSGNVTEEVKAAISNKMRELDLKIERLKKTQEQSAKAAGAWSMILFGTGLSDVDRPLDIAQQG